MFYVQAEDGTKIAVYDYGCKGLARQQDTIFFVHGWPLSHKIYEYQIPMLIEKGYRVVAIDLRGFGMSDAPGCNYGYDQMASDIYQVVRRLNLSAFTLVGFSMGGAIALRYMHRCRGYGVRRLILLSAAAPCWTRRPGYPYGLTDDAVNEMFCQIETDRAKFSADLMENKFFACPHSCEVKQWFTQIALSASAVGTLQALCSLKNEDGRDDLKWVKVPTVIIHGAKDTIVSSELAQLQYKGIEGSRLYTLKNSSHGIMYDELQEFNHIFGESIC